MDIIWWRLLSAHRGSRFIAHSSYLYGYGSTTQVPQKSPDSSSFYIMDQTKEGVNPKTISGFAWRRIQVLGRTILCQHEECSEELLHALRLTLVGGPACAPRGTFAARQPISYRPFKNSLEGTFSMVAEILSVPVASKSYIPSFIN